MQPGQQNDYGFIPDSHSDLPYTVYLGDWPVFWLVLIVAVVVVWFLMRRRSRR